MDSFEKTADVYIDGLTHIGADHPYAVSLKRIGAEIDKKVSVSMIKEFNSTVRSIEALKPVDKEVDEDSDDLLSPA